MGLISRVSSRTYRNLLDPTKSKMVRSSLLRWAITKAPLANGPLKAPTNLDNFHHRNFVKYGGAAFTGSFTCGLIWLWLIRIPNAEQVNCYIKHVDLKERADAMYKWGVFQNHPTDWQKANIAKLSAGDDDEEEDDE